MPMHVFLDTNVLLHCKDLEALPWSELTDDEEIIVVATRTVQRELDKIKNDPKKPRQKRARQVAAIFSKASALPHRTLSIRDASPRVKLQLLGRPERVVSPLSLDAENADECLVAEVAGFVEDGKTPYVFVSGDSYPLIFAQDNHLETWKTLPSWELPAEKSEEELELERTRTELAAFKSRQPKLTVGLSSSGGEPVARLVFSAYRYASLTGDDLDQLMHSICTRFPRRERPTPKAERPTEGAPGELGSVLRAFHDISAGILSAMQPSEEQFKRYWDAYEKWKEEVREKLQLLPNYFSESTRKFAFSISLANEGSQPAEGVILDFQIPAGFNLHRARDDKQEVISFPRCPAAPTTSFGGIPGLASYVQHVETFPYLRPALNQADRARRVQALRFVDATDDGRSVRLACDELRQGVGFASYDLLLTVDEDAPAQNVGLRYLVSANNLLKPFEGQVPVLLSVVDAALPTVDIESLFAEDE